MEIIPEVKTIAELVLLTLTMLLGQEGVDFCYYEQDPEWWRLRLYMRRN